MAKLAAIDIKDTDLEAMAEAKGRVAIAVYSDGKMDLGGRRANSLTRGTVKRFLDDPAFEKARHGEVK